MALQGLGDAVVSLSLAGPSAAVGVGVQDLDVGELVGQCWAEFGCRSVVIAGFANVRVRARALALVA